MFSVVVFSTAVCGVVVGVVVVYKMFMCSVAVFSFAVCSDGVCTVVV